MTTYRPPASIAGHPGVQECVSAADNGAPPYRHDVFLKEGWVFGAGHMAGCRSGLFRSVTDFRNALPQRDDEKAA